MTLPPGLTDEALAAAAAESDPTSLAASVRLRVRFGPETAAAAATQVVLRRRARLKFGPAAAEMFFTRDGLEQATRPAVARRRAARFAQAGVTGVVDLGCGIGSDALAFVDAGLEVVAVERDPTVADIARANLGGRADLGARANFGGRTDVIVGEAESLAGALLTSGWGVFCDPARRTPRGRSWRVEDLSPSWEFVRGLLSGERTAAVKLGPGLPHRLVPPDAEAEWVSEAGETVELGLWAGPGTEPGVRAAVVSPEARLVTDPDTPSPAVSDVGGYLYEPAGAVIRSGGLATLAQVLGAALVHPDVAYLTGDQPRSIPFATAFKVLDVFGYQEKALRHWVREHRVGSLEIKTRGLDLDPAVLRRRLRLAGDRRATVVLTRGRAGKIAIVVERLSGWGVREYA